MIFKVPPSHAALSNGPTFSLGLDIEQTLAELYATDATFTEAAMSFMTPPNASEPVHVRQRGAKMLVYHGVSDPIFSVRRHRQPGTAASTAPAASVLTSSHGCTACPAWATAPAGRPPTRPTSSRRWCTGSSTAARQARSSPRRAGAGNAGGVNAEVPADWAASRTRPLCPYPIGGALRGRGDVELAANWACTGRNGDRGHGGHDD